MEASSSRPSTEKRRSGGGRGSIHSLGADLLCTIFVFLDPLDLVRCSVVCNSWHNIIYTSTLMRDLYFKKKSNVRGISYPPNPSETSVKMYFEELAMEQHRSAFLSGSVEVHQWSGHSARVNTCRMKRAVILTGGGDKVLRLWSAENYDRLDEYSFSDMDPIVDYDFDENKIVGLFRARICIWRRNGQRSVFQSHENNSTRSLCMRYIDPEAVIGCEDGRARIFDMYSGRLSRIIRMHAGPVTCLDLTDEHLILGGSSFGTISIADLSSGERLAFLKSSISPTGMSSLCFNTCSNLLFAGSTAGYAHCWDLRTLRPLWETRVSPNVIYSTHLWNNSSTLAVGGLDGVLRILNRDTGELILSFLTDAGKPMPISSNNRMDVIEKKRVRTLSEDTCLDSIPRYIRPPITCLAVGLKKIVTTHNEKYIRVWRFYE